MKIYDARQDGGFYVPLREPPCRASDECHGPGTQAPPPPDIGTYRGDGGQAEAEPPKKKKKKPRCRGKRVKRIEPLQGESAQAPSAGASPWLR